MKTILFALITILLPLVLNPATSTPAGTIPPLHRPNVLLIILDDAAPLLSSYGGPVHTPNMDALAAQGRRYTQAFANSTGCNPSRVSFATGLLPLCVNTMLQTDWRAVMDGCTPGLGSNVRTMYRTFADAGYSTLAVGKIMHTAQQQTAEFQESIFYAPGDWLDQIANSPLHGLTEYYSIGTPLRDWGRLEDLRGHNGETFGEHDLTDWRITTDAIERMGALQEPFLLAVGLVGPHWPRYAPGRLYSKYLSTPLPDVLMNDADDMPHVGRQRSSENTQNRMVIRDILSHRAVWQGFNAAYYAGLEFADEQVGRLLAEVPDNTIVVVWSDHGYHLGQKLKVEKGALWRESYHIPLIIAGPGVEPGIVADVTNSTEVYPLLLGLAGLSATDGIDRTPIADGLIAFDGHVAIDDGSHALILYNVAGQRAQEFYDLHNDPLQWRNLGGGVEYRQRLLGYLAGN